MNELRRLRPDSAALKNRGFRTRLGYAFSGIRTVARREKSFRTQLGLGTGALLLTAGLRPGWAWAALVLLSVGFVLALELANSALEYALDRLHPRFSAEIGAAKDAAAGAVLAASAAAAGVGALMVLASLEAR